MSGQFLGAIAAGVMLCLCAVLIGAAFDVGRSE